MSFENDSAVDGEAKSNMLMTPEIASIVDRVKAAVQRGVDDLEEGFILDLQHLWIPFLRHLAPLSVTEKRAVLWVMMEESAMAINCFINVARALNSPTPTG